MELLVPDSDQTESSVGLELGRSEMGEVESLRSIHVGSLRTEYGRQLRCASGCCVGVVAPEQACLGLEALLPVEEAIPERGAHLDARLLGRYVSHEVVIGPLSKSCKVKALLVRSTFQFICVLEASVNVQQGSCREAGVTSLIVLP